MPKYLSGCGKVLKVVEIDIKKIILFELNSWLAVGVLLELK
jgi:hypothetical protein